MGSVPLLASTRARSATENGIGFEDVLLMLFAVSAIVGHVAFFASLTVRTYWLLTFSMALAGATALAFKAARPAREVRLRKDRMTWLGILVAIALALCLHRPDGDDRTYLAQEVRALDHPEASYRSLAEAPAYNAGYVMSPVEYLRAGISWLTGLPLLGSYYLLWPAVIAAMTVAYQSRLLKALGVESLPVALLMWFVVMLAWGDAHRTPANFGLVRMFQGKSAVIWVTIPAAQYHWLRFVEFGERRSLLLMNAAVIAGIGLSPTGVPVGVLLIALFTVATAFRHGISLGRWKSLAAVGTAGIYPVMIGLLMRFYFGHTPESGILPGELLSAPPAAAATAPTAPTALPPLPAPTTVAPPVRDAARVNLSLALGGGRRSIVAIVCMAALPIFLRRSPVAALFSIYSILCTLLLAFPWSSELMGTYAFSSFSWRWLFVIPLVLSVALAVERIALRFERPLARGAVTALLAMGFLTGPSFRVLSEGNHTRFTTPGFKLDSDHELPLAGYEKPARVEGWRLISPSTGARY